MMKTKIRSIPKDKLEYTLEHALPPGARKSLPSGKPDPTFQRKFTAQHVKDLARHDVVTTDQIRALEKILPAIAYYTQALPTLTDARRPLVDLARAIATAESSMRSLLNAPRDGGAREESRERFLHSLEKLYPDRCPPNPRHFHEPRPEDGLAEAKRLLGSLQDVAATAKHALDSMPRKQSRPVAQSFPILLIYAALNTSGVQRFDASSAKKSPFRQVVQICYQAAGAMNTDPLRAIRAFMGTTGRKMA